MAPAKLLILVFISIVSGMYKGLVSSVKLGSSAFAAIIPENKSGFSPVSLSPIKLPQSWQNRVMSLKLSPLIKDIILSQCVL